MDPIHQYIVKRAKEQKLVINEESIGNLLSSIKIIGEDKEYTLKFNKLSFLIYWLQFFKDHIHDLHKIYEGRWYGSHFHEYLHNLCGELAIGEEIYNNLDSYLLQLYSQIDGEQIFFVEGDNFILRYQGNEVILNFEDKVLITTMNKKELHKFLKSIDCNLSLDDIKSSGKGTFEIKAKEVMDQLNIFFTNIERRPKIDGAYQDFVKYFKLLLLNSSLGIGKGFPIFRKFISTNETNDFIVTHSLTHKYKTALELSVTLDRIDGEALNELYDENADLNFYIDQENHRSLPQTFPFFNKQTWSIGLLDKGQFYEQTGFGFKQGNRELKDLGEGRGKKDAIQLDVSNCKINFFLDDIKYFEVGWFWNDKGPNFVINHQIHDILSAKDMERDKTFIGAFAKYSGDQMPMLYDCIITPNRFLLSGDKKNIEMGMSIHILIKLGLLKLYKNDGEREVKLEPYLKIIRERIAGLDADESPLVIVTDQYHRELAVKLSKIYKSREAIKQSIKGSKIRELQSEIKDLEQATYHTALFFIAVYEIDKKINQEKFMSILGDYKYTKDLRGANKIDKKIMKQFKKKFKTKYSLIYKQPKTLNNIMRMVSYLNTDDDSFKEKVFIKINQLHAIDVSSNTSSSDSDLDERPRERKSKKKAQTAIRSKSRRHILRRTKRNRSDSSNNSRINSIESSNKSRINSIESSSSGKHKSKKARSRSAYSN
jgi:hypothetical protein